MRLAQLLWECDEEEENFWENDQEQIFLGIWTGILLLIVELHDVLIDTVLLYFFRMGIQKQFVFIVQL